MPSRPRGRPRSGEDRTGIRIAEITAAAAELFAQRGYDETSLQDVGAAVGMLKGSLYHYIGSRDELLLWVLRRNHEQLHGRAVEAVEEARQAAGKDPSGVLVAFVVAHVEHVVDNASLSALHAQRFAQLEGRPALHAEILGLRRTHENLLAGLLRELTGQDCASADLDPTMTARSLLGMYNAAHLWAHPADAVQRQRIVDHHVLLTLRAVGAVDRPSA